MAVPHKPSGAPWSKPGLAYQLFAPSVAVLAMALTMIPYLIGFTVSGGRRFMWLGYNLDDSCVYLSWMRQAADGAARNLNLFTTDPQHGMAPNPLFWLLGSASGITHLPLIAIYHGARIACGLALLMAVWDLIRATLPDTLARPLSFLLVCFSAGLGWLPFWWNGPLPAPVDSWQPEAITFLSLYLSPLFCFSLCLQVLIVRLLLAGDRAHRARFACLAGLCGFALGLTHTYDVITMGAVWSVYLGIQTLQAARRGHTSKILAGPWLRAAIAGAMTLPAVLYIAYQLRTEAVFQARANVPTLTPAANWLLLGYGGLLLLAATGAYQSLRTPSPGEPDVASTPNSKHAYAFPDAALLLVCWSIVNFAVAYLPMAFQRKLLQGDHIPIALLAGVGAVSLWERVATRAARSWHAAAYAVAITALLCPTNVLFLARDSANFVAGVAQTRVHRTHLQPGEIAALEWVRDNSPVGTAVQPLPWVGQLSTDKGTRIYTRDVALMCFTPGLIDRPVYCGHWGETPQYSDKLDKLRSFVTASHRMDDAGREAFARSMRVRYLIFSQKHSTDASAAAEEETDTILPVYRGRLPLPPYLKLSYSNPDADVFEVVPQN